MILAKWTQRYGFAGKAGPEVDESASSCLSRETILKI